MCSLVRAVSRAVPCSTAGCPGAWNHYITQNADTAPLLSGTSIIRMDFHLTWSVQLFFYEQESKQHLMMKTESRCVHYTHMHTYTDGRKKGVRKIRGSEIVGLYYLCNKTRHIFGGTTFFLYLTAAPCTLCLLFLR